MNFKKFLVVVLGLASIGTPLFAAESATALVQHIEQNLSPSSVKARYQFTNYRTDGSISTYEVLFTVKDFDHSFGIFLKPEREKDREILRLNDAIWTYMPSVGRAVRIADRDSFAGGDFSNADVLRLDWSDQYDAKVVKETPHQWILDLAAKTPNAPYAKIRLWIDQSTRQPVQTYFYDSKGTLLKRCLYGAATSFGPFTRPARTVMENVITGQKSEMRVIGVTPTTKIPDSRFVIDNLGK